MKKIILANIGNRNLTYQEKTIIPDERRTEVNDSFRQKTEALLPLFDEVVTELDEQILSRLIEKMGSNTIDKVVLFASDQPEKHKQDTIFEAQILQRLLKHKFGVDVEVVAYTGSVVDNDALLNYYRNTFSQWRVQQPNALFTVCDAGGTPQQKAALKIAAEFLFEPSQYEVKYITQPYDGKSAKVLDVNQVEYRRIIDEEQVIALVEHGQYGGALYVYEQLKDSIKNPDVLALLRFLNYRSELFYADAQNEITTNLKEKNAFFANFKVGKLAGTFDDFRHSFSSKAFRALCERLEIAHYRFQLGDLSRAALGLSIFIESWVNEAIQQQGQFKLVGEYSRAEKELLKQVIENPDYTHLLAYFGGANDIRSGLPLHLKFLEQTTTSNKVREVVMLFLPLNSRTNQSNGKLGLDCLRNRLAHKGESVKEGELLKHVPTIKEVFSKTRKLLELPEENSYNTLNHLLVSLLRK